MSSTKFDSTVFKERIFDLMEKQNVTIKQIVNDKEGDISFAWFSKLRKNAIKSPSADIVYTLADYFGVSSDYLLGLSDVPTTDADLRAVCEYTGLSDEAVEFIKSTKGNIKISVESINLMLSHDNGTAFFSELSDTLKLIEDANRRLNLSHGFLNAYPDTFSKISENGYSNATNLTDEDIGRYKGFKRSIKKHQEICSMIELKQFRIGKIMQAITACEGVSAEYYIKKRGEFD